MSQWFVVFVFHARCAQAGFQCRTKRYAMRAKLLALHSPDLKDLKKGQLSAPTHFCLYIQAFIGPEGQRGEESFDILVCTPSWIAKEIAEQGYIWGRHRLVVSEYDYDLIWNAISEICSKTEAADWSAVAGALNHFGAWEFSEFRTP